MDDDSSSSTALDRILSLATKVVAVREDGRDAAAVVTEQPGATAGKEEEEAEQHRRTKQRKFALYDSSHRLLFSGVSATLSDGRFEVSVTMEDAAAGPALTFKGKHHEPCNVETRMWKGATYLGGGRFDLTTRLLEVYGRGGFKLSAERLDGRSGGGCLQCCCKTVADKKHAREYMMVDSQGAPVAYVREGRGGDLVDAGGASAAFAVDFFVENFPADPDGSGANNMRVRAKTVAVVLGAAFLVHFKSH